MLHALAHIEYRRDRSRLRHGRAVRRRPAARLRRRLARRSAPTRRCISPCSTGGCARSARAMARCPRMTACGRRRRRPRTICSPGWRWCRWCWRRAGSTSRRRPSRAFERAGDARSAAILGAHLPRRDPPCRGRHALVQNRLRIPRTRAVAALARADSARTSAGRVKPPFNDSARGRSRSVPRFLRRGCRVTTCLTLSGHAFGGQFPDACSSGAGRPLNFQAVA